MKGGPWSSVVGPWPESSHVVRRTSHVEGKVLKLLPLVTLLSILPAPSTFAGQAATDSASRDQHIRELISELPIDSQLRKALIDGTRGDGVRHTWMDEMRKRGVKTAVVSVAINFSHAGKPSKIRVAQARYYSGYDDRGLISDVQTLNGIRGSSLEKQITELALEKAAHGYWIDIPRPRPHPFVGGTRVQFFDDEWLPTFGVLYCAGEACISE